MVRIEQNEAIVAVWALVDYRSCFLLAIHIYRKNPDRFYGALSNAAMVKVAGNPYDPSAYDTARYYHNIDPVVEVLPVKTWMASYLRQGDVPLWIPSLFSGSPFAANHHAAPWDVSTIFFLLLPSKIAFGITLLFQLFIAGALTFFCCRVFGLSIRPSLLAAAGYMFNSFFFHWLGLISFNAGLIWLPLVPAGIELALRIK